jgi:activator of HSP90 ATPase
MYQIIKEHTIKAKAIEVWQCFFDKNKFKAWGGAECMIEEKVSTYFQYWEKEVSGKILLLEKPKKIVFEYLDTTWGTLEHATFEINLKEKIEGEKYKTFVYAVMSNFPVKKLADISSDLDEWYFKPIKKHLEENTTILNQ